MIQALILIAAIAKKESKTIASDLKEYCGFDTYAMFAVWKELRQLLQSAINFTIYVRGRSL